MPQDLSPCPFCGESKGYTLSDGSTFRWWVVSCAGCGGDVGECRSDSSTRLDAPKPERWPAADDEWNEAAAHAQSLRAALETQAAEIARLRELLQEAADYTRHPDYDWPVEFCRRVSAAREST